MQFRLPPFSSCLFFELYEGDSDPYVRLLYKNSTEPGQITQLDIPNCGMKCPLQKLYELYDQILPNKSHTEECALGDDEKMPSVEDLEAFPLAQ